MPHRPEGQGLSLSGINSSAIYTPPRVAGSAAATIMRQTSSLSALHKSTPSSTLYGAHSSGVVTPVVKSKPWTGSSSIASSNKSSDSTDRSTGTTDDSRSTATLATEDEREATASALLMVAKVAEREHYLSSVISSSSTVLSSTLPLKKGKKQMYILRRQEQDNEDESANKNSRNNNYATDENTTVTNNSNNKDNTSKQNPCHISPVSHSSSEHGMIGTGTESSEDGTPVRRTNPAATNNSAHSYDSKDLHPSYRNSGRVSKGESTQELLDSSKVHSTAQIGSSSSVFPSQVTIPHFPTVLHHVLVDKDFDGTVIQWLPNGETWKVVRWDAMRRQVLPKYFADLRDEDGSGCGTIDAFLYHLDAWGFEEIQDGTNAGAYRHDLFIRGAQKLCVKMRFTSDLTDGDKAPKAVSPSRSHGGETERSMLQVPMLASVGIDSKKQAQSVNKRPRYDTQAPMHWPYSTNDSPVIWGGQHPHDVPHARAYGMRAAAAMSNPYSPNGMYNIDPRIQLCRVPPTPENMSRQIPLSQQQYNPPQVRSGRGALKLSTSAKNRASTMSSQYTTPVFRHGFPVSNRGKGPRKPAACRTPLVPPTTATIVAISCDSKQQESKQAINESPSKPHMSVTLDQAQQIGNSVNGVAVAISRKTKRKLPLAAMKKSDVDGPSDNSAASFNKETNSIDHTEKTIESSS